MSAEHAALDFGYRSCTFRCPQLMSNKQSSINSMNFRAETQRLESLYQRKLAALDELKKSLLHQAFSGKL